VIYGSSTPIDVDLANLGSAGFRIDAAAANDTVAAVDGIGDFNGDGIDDVVVGAGSAREDGENLPLAAGSENGSDGTRTRGLRRDRPAL
jgi:hypothetical protein